MQSECLMEDQEKCTMQYALNVDKSVKFHSSLIRTDLYTAENATLNEDPREEIDTKLISQGLFWIFNLFYFNFLSHTHMRRGEKQL